MEWTLLIGSAGFVALVLTGSWLSDWGRRHGRRGPLWSLLRVFVALRWLLDALPGDRSQVELPAGNAGPPRSAETRGLAGPRARKRRSRQRP